MDQREIAQTPASFLFELAWWHASSNVLRSTRRDNIPGAVINALSEEKRTMLKSLTSEDASNIPDEYVKVICDRGNYLSEEMMKFDRKLGIMPGHVRRHDRKYER